MGGVEIVLHWVVVGRCGDDDEVSVLVCLHAIGGSLQVEYLFSQVLLDVVVLDRRPAMVDQLYFLWYDIHSRHLMMLAKQCDDAKTYIACTCHCYFNILVCHFFVVCLMGSFSAYLIIYRMQR